MSLPQITELEFETEDLQTELEPIGKSFLYDFKKGDFVISDGKLVKVFETDSLKVWIEKIIRTAQFKFQVYEDKDYGTTIDGLIGSNLPRSFVEAELKRVITEALLTHDHIEEINEWQFERDGKVLSIYFKVRTIDEAFEMEVSL